MIVASNNINQTNGIQKKGANEATQKPNKNTNDYSVIYLFEFGKN